MCLNRALSKHTPTKTHPHPTPPHPTPPTPTHPTSTQVETARQEVAREIAKEMEGASAAAPLHALRSAAEQVATTLEKGLEVRAVWGG
jgi:hypothetical protein